MVALAADDRAACPASGSPGARYVPAARLRTFLALRGQFHRAAPTQALARVLRPPDRNRGARGRQRPIAGTPQKRDTDYHSDGAGSEVYLRNHRTSTPCGSNRTRIGRSTRMADTRRRGRDSLNLSYRPSRNLAAKLSDRSCRPSTSPCTTPWPTMRSSRSGSARAAVRDRNRPNPSATAPPETRQPAPGHAGTLHRYRTRAARRRARPALGDQRDPLAGTRPCRGHAWVAHFVRKQKLRGLARTAARVLRVRESRSQLRLRDARLSRNGVVSESRCYSVGETARAVRPRRRQSDVRWTTRGGHGERDFAGHVAHIRLIVTTTWYGSSSSGLTSSSSNSDDHRSRR